jgi:hypothetical protein
MNLDPIIQASLPTTLASNKPVGPTLMIGLGGTGKEVLLRLRRKLVERYGALSRLPFLQFMHVDTDKTATAHEQYDLRAADDPLFEQVRFQANERVNLAVAGGTAKYVDHINQFPQINRWFPGGGKIAHLGDLGEGAGQIRIASRLGFFDATNFRNIGTRLAQCKEILSAPSVLAQAAPLGFNFDANSVRVFLIASLGGGTGSGTFLDAAFLVRQYFAVAERVGMLLMPGFYSAYAGSERVRANGYAALMELSHYTFGHSFLCDWSGRENRRMSPPPFSSTYLIDVQNEAGLVIGSAGKEYDAYQMVAEVLFQDYTIGAFAGTKRATRVNLENFNLEVYTHNFLNDALRRSSNDTHKTIVGDTYPCRFGSFGLATISFPTERVQSACASRLAARILDHWQKSVLDNPLEPLFTTFLADEQVKCAQGRYERRDDGGVIERSDIEDALMVFDAGGGKTFSTFLWQKAQAMRSELQAAPNGQKAARLAERRNELDQFFAREDSQNPDEWGIGIRLLQSNMRTYLERVKTAIEKKAAEMSDNAQYGVSYTLSLLREFKSLLRNPNENFRYIRHFDEQFPLWRDAVQHYGHELDQLQMDVGRHEGQHLFRSPDLSRDYEKLVGEDGDEDPGAFYSHFWARVQKQVAKRGREVCEELDHFLGPDAPGTEGLLGRYYDLLVGFARVKEHLQRKEHYFAKPEKSELALTLFRDGDVDEWYRTWIGEGGMETEKLKAVADQILTEIFQVDGVTAALERIQRTPSETVEELMLAKCRDFIAAHPKQPEALTMLFDANRITPRQREDMVRLAYRLGKVWMAPSEGSEHTGLPPVRTDQRPCLIGFHRTGHVPRVTEFERLIASVHTPGDTLPSFHDVGSEHRGMIVFYNELAGVPAFYPSSVTAPGGLRASYNAYAEKEELHTDKNRFQFNDILPKQPSEAREYADSLQAFVLARILGLLQVHELPGDGEHRRFRFSYPRKTDGLIEKVDLGEEAHAVDYMFRDKRSEHLTHRHFLLQKIDDTVLQLRKQQKLPVYCLLLDFYLQHVYPPQEVTNTGLPMMVTQYSPDYAVLHQAQQRLMKIVGDEKERMQFERAFAATFGKTVNAERTYEEFQQALAPYCKAAGMFEARATNVAMLEEKTEWRDVFALDMTKIDKSAAKDAPVVPIRPATPIVQPDKPAGDRPCPNCSKPVDSRAAFCIHCKQTVATHVVCPHCQEAHVPSDLELCWKCGLRMREDEQVDCPQCFSWRGYEEQFPCPHCGYDPKAGVAPVPPVGDPILTVNADDGGGNGKVSAEPPGSAPLTPPPPLPLVQCSICYSMVEPGPRCPICTSVLESR